MLYRIVVKTESITNTRWKKIVRQQQVDKVQQSVITWGL